MNIDKMSNEIVEYDFNNNEKGFDDFNPDARIETSKIDEVMQLFEISKWNELNIIEQDEAILDLKDAIATDLELKNVPEIEYFFDDDECNLGYYSPIDNTFHLNGYNLDKPESIAKTIAHELRHCWQVEQINLPEEMQTDFSRVLKFNDENYIEPYDNYEAYCNQPMEVDARLYADKITSKD